MTALREMVRTTRESTKGKTVIRLPYELVRRGAKDDRERLIRRAERITADDVNQVMIYEFASTV